MVPEEKPKPPKLTHKQTERARQARKQPSVAEIYAWSLLRNRSNGFKFRREHSIGRYRLDFYCAEVKVAIEFDGEQHNPVYDSERDAYLSTLGILVIRIPNREFFQIEGEGKLVDHLGLALMKCEELREMKQKPSAG